MSNILPQLKKMASKLNSTRLAGNPELKYHVMADALYWSDEIPDDLDEDSGDCLRLILNYRMSLILGTVPTKWQEYWDKARHCFPHWIGFLPERCKASDSLARVFLKMQRDAGF